MTPVDLTLWVILLVGVISGYRGGFLMELFSLIALLAGVLGAFKLLGYAMILLEDEFNVSKTILPYVAFAVVFIAIVIAVRLLGKLIKVSIDRTFLGRIDQVAGALLGLIKAAFLLSVALWIIDALHIGLPERWTSQSWLLPKIEAFAPQITHWIAAYIPLFKDVFT
ncbi:MAG TPA: CvpA family protein [Chryseosolibacter sp.]